jgi:hypothetical protein
VGNERSEIIKGYSEKRGPFTKTEVKKFRSGEGKNIKAESELRKSENQTPDARFMIQDS